ncbi:MAG: hypothetical protein KKA54_01520 [Proteobacteria bacterium]|nr:hypothetical protein [Pseudomonadota bacterium]
MADEKKQIYPLLLEKNKRWIGAIEKGIAALDPREQKLVMQDAGRDCSPDIWGLCEKALGSPVDSVDDLIRGWNLVRQSRNLHGDWVVEGNVVHGVFTECGCPLVRAGLVELQPVQCWCSQNMMEGIFSRAAKGKVSGEVKQSIGRGDKVCEFYVTF